MPSNGKAKPFPYQQEGVAGIERFNGRTLLADEPGLGKTLQSLWWLQRHPEAQPAVVVCPASVKYVWEVEAANNLGIRATVLDGQTPSDNGIARPPKLTVINYDILQYWVDRLKSLGPQTVILDEAHYCANKQARRTRAARELCKGVPHVLSLTGTPLVNRPIELWTVLNILQPKLFPSYWSFGHRYCGAKLTNWGWQFKGATRSAELHGLLTKHLMIRRRKADVLSELPDKIRRIVPLPLSDPREYQQANDNFLVWLAKQGGGKVAKAARAKRFTQLGYLKRLSAKLKLRAAVEWVNHWFDNSDGSEKLVMFAWHTKMIEALARRCKQKSVVVSGSVQGRLREASIAQFRDDPKTRLFIGQIKACGVGINGLQVASTAAFAELPWTPGEVTQAEDRLHRIGQGGTVWIYFLVAAHTIESMLCNVLQSKQDVLSATLDGGRRSEDLSVFDQLMTMVREGVA